ncbi:acetyl/propionyl/methylcrotonyl-CoA carboxylase subunit alpha [Georgenia thermotolerans]|uniref:biotin carboxylase n=1 Tax=Georgenia thermotolerans TaxID=527326 RepID=A0A7J5UQK7_9MICO|nr:biotin carboxylase N-terminal domain-containing protein [Georgenia thermotolerans]KAE8764692.1 ATP-grasp domain-containing protein [Georgenia thermotolerans]
MRKVLIANRGEIALRVVHACADAGLASVAVYADPDAAAPHALLADEAYNLPGSSATETYLDIARLLEVARRSGADAVHPGYGFLSENAGFAQAVLDAGLTWIGPPPEAIRVLGDKVEARELARRVGAPLVAGSDGPVPSAIEARRFAETHGVPVVIKAAFGGGGRGMRVVHHLDDVEDAFASAQRESRAAFGRDECYVERFLDRPRHVEAQVLADTHGNVVVMGTRDCSLQRRHQKLVEEAPAPFLTAEQRRRVHDSARAICAEVGYVGAGTVEFLLGAGGDLTFLEVNTRLQVEHPVTEATTGIDLVRAQLAVADGQEVPVRADPEPSGHAIELRINAEDVGRGFLPSTGTITAFVAPSGPGVRLDTGVRQGSVVSPHFDSLLAKVVVHGRDRQEALRRARRAAAEMEIAGVATVLPFHRAVLRDPDFTAPDHLGVYTTWIEQEFRERVAADPDFHDSSPAGRRRVVLDVDGRRVVLGLPADLLAGLASGGADGAGSHDGAAAAPADAAVLTAPMGGTVVRWLVEPGEQVARGDAVVLLEAMKTETRLVAHRDGVVEPRVAAGEHVDTGAALAVIEG